MKKLVVLIFLLLIIFIVGSLWWIHGTSPVNASDTRQKTFVVQPGEPLRTIANHLQANGLINDPIVFFLITKTNGLDNKIEAGDFRLSPNMSASEIAQTMTKGTLDVWVTVPEGFRATEIAQVLKQKLPQYTEAWQTDLQANEGYLFPDTYSVQKSATIEQIIQQMRQNFTQRYASITPNTRQSYTQNQIVTVASLVEREAKFPEDRPLVASVIYNRLQAGMPLDIDASVQYAIGTSAKWWPTLTTSGSETIPTSPYNTYTNVGLPPTPICNPGLAAITAAINPAQTNYVYYISDSSGHNHYEETLAEHNADIKKYLGQ